MAKSLRKPSCHPDRKYSANDLCAACYRREWLRQHPGSRKPYDEKRRQTYHRNQVDLRAYKLLRGCMDCGYDVNADALEFDHRVGEKRRDVVGALAYYDEYLLGELAKCDVVCSNCHSIRTANRRREAIAAAQ